jgi:hypothetical protein
MNAMYRIDGHDFPHVPSASLSHVNPYVREMNGTENIMHHSVGRIDTRYQPLLSNQIVNNVQTNSQIYNPTVQNVTGNNSIHGIHSGHDSFIVVFSSFFSNVIFVVNISS